MIDQVRQATRELRWEQIQTAIVELLREGAQPITVVEIARRCEIPRSAIAKEQSWKDAVAAAEAQRLTQRAEHLQQRQAGLRGPELPAVEHGAGFERRRVTIETVVSDLQGLMAKAAQDAHDAYARGRDEALRELPAGLEPKDVEGREAAAFEKGAEAGRAEAVADLNEAYARGREEGHKEFREDLNQAYQRGLADGGADAAKAGGSYEQGKRDGRQEAAAEHQNQFERGRQMGRAELQVELKKAYDDGMKEGKKESAADVMNAYDRGRRDGWEEGRREGTAPNRSVFGFSVARPNPDREWALALLHAGGNATADQLRATYRMLTKAYHPDRNPDIPPEFIRNLNRAKEILGF